MMPQYATMYLQFAQANTRTKNCKRVLPVKRRKRTNKN